MRILSEKFQDRDLKVVWMDGKPHWMFETASTLAGHASVEVTMTVVGRDAEFKDPAFTISLKGAKYREFKQLAKVLNLGLSTFASKITLFTEAGLWLLIDKSDSEIGREYRRFFSAEVAPQIARDGHYSPDRQVEGGYIVDHRAPAGPLQRLSEAWAELGAPEDARALLATAATYAELGDDARALKLLHAASAAIVKRPAVATARRAPMTEEDQVAARRASGRERTRRYRERQESTKEPVMARDYGGRFAPSQRDLKQEILATLAMGPRTRTRLRRELRANHQEVLTAVRELLANAEIIEDRRSDGAWLLCPDKSEH